ncbi:MAG: uracil-DNA glycosylase [Micrococcaceae bacterium]
MGTSMFEQYAHPSWVEALQAQLGNIKKIEQYLRQEALTGKKILPYPDKTYRALSQNINDTKLLILGQDPYPTPGHPVGLAFSADPHVKPIPKSLINIYQELHDDLNIPIAPHGDLTAWEKQGVMLLNTALSVEAGNAGSHKNLWAQFSQAVVEVLASRNKPLVAILWGKNAQNYASSLAPYPTIQSVHPSPLSAYRGFFGSKPFSKCNALLEQQGATAIDWNLNPSAT